MIGVRLGIKPILLASGIAILTSSLFYGHREAEIDRLFSQASQGLAVGAYPDDMLDAVRKLSTYRGKRVTAMLLAIGQGNSGFQWPAVRLEAINLLAMRNDPSISTALARQLQLHEPLEIRQAVAKALTHVACSLECTEAILHYLERLYRGEQNWEHQVMPPDKVLDVFGPELLESEQSVYADLRSVLVREGQFTTVALSGIYGLGTRAPSDFALDLLNRIQLMPACPLLLQSQVLRNAADLPGPSKGFNTAVQF